LAIVVKSHKTKSMMNYQLTTKLERRTTSIKTPEGTVIKYYCKITPPIIAAVIDADTIYYRNLIYQL
jgi:hypothetical protein